MGRITLRSALLCTGLLFGAHAEAADMAQGRFSPPHQAQTLRSKRVSVVVDQLSLVNGCPRDPACIAPRVLPIIGSGEARERTYRGIAILVDPRFTDRY